MVEHSICRVEIVSDLIWVEDVCPKRLMDRRRGNYELANVLPLSCYTVRQSLCFAAKARFKCSPDSLRFLLSSLSEIFLLPFSFILFVHPW